MNVPRNKTIAVSATTLLAIVASMATPGDPLKPVPESLTFAVTADSIVPPTNPQHSLIRITSPFTDAKFADVEVIAVINGMPAYMPTVEAREPGVFVFTGPPGNYALKASGYYEDRGFVKRYANTVIMGGVAPIPPLPDPDPVPPKPDPKPDPKPEPPKPQPPSPVDEFDNVGQLAASLVVELKLDAVDKIAANHQDVSDRLLGIRTPPIPTIDIAVAVLQQENAKVIKNAAAWKTWAERLGVVWDKHVTDRTTAAKFMAAVAAGLRASQPVKEAVPEEVVPEFESATG